jgi:hypothetical protein
MTAEPKVMDDGRTVTVRVSISIRKRGGRKLVLAPDGHGITAAPIKRHIDNSIIKATARAFRWQAMLENGTCATISEISASEKINETYVGRVLRLTLLEPAIVEAILNGRQPTGLQLDRLMRRFPVGWREQRATFSAEANCARHQIKCASFKKPQAPFAALTDTQPSAQALARYPSEPVFPADHGSPRRRQSAGQLRDLPQPQLVGRIAR